MKTSILAVLAALVLTASALATLAPEADARAVCSRAIDGNACPSWVCQWRQPGYWYCDRDILQEICIRCWGPDALP